MINEQVECAVSKFHAKVFNPLRSEVQEKLEKTESMYKLCVDMLAEGDWHLPDESNQKPVSASVTPTRKSNLSNIVWRVDDNLGNCAIILCSILPVKKIEIENDRVILLSAGTTIFCRLHMWQIE